MTDLPNPMLTKPFGGATDEEARDLLVAHMTGALAEVTEIIQAAKDAGYLITYATGEVDGQQQVMRLEIVKIL